MKRILAVALLAALACGKSGNNGPPAKDPGFGQSGTQASFDLDAELGAQNAFYDLPYPSDLRVDADGKPRLDGFPNRRDLPLIDAFKKIATDRKGFPVVPVAYFRFSAAIALRNGAELIAPGPDAAVLLIDVDVNSPYRGKLVPVVVSTPAVDDYVPSNLLAVAPRPGFVLAANRTYAFVVRRSMNDALGKPLGVPAALDRLRAGQIPDGTLGAQARDVYAPLWTALPLANIDPKQVAAATVFTTGDAVADTAALVDKIAAAHPIELKEMKLLVDAPGSERVCIISATVSYPQFQTGKPPFNSDGLFQFGSDGLPIQQRTEDAPVILTIPKIPMPAGGYPLVLYFHGSGGASADVIDRGPSHVTNGPMDRGRGPAWVHAQAGLAAAGSALPVNPERLPGASDTAYLNLVNPVAMRDTFRQGISEQRMFLDALLKLQISPDLLTGCSGPALPQGATAFHFDPDKVIAQGQSMGGMYTNLVSATDKRIKLAIPTGAGGFWTWFVLVTQLYPQPDLSNTLALLLSAAQGLNAQHPALHLVESGWEPADPMVSMPRVGRRPLPGHPVRPVYEPVGRGDEYFPTVLYDAMALAYGHQEAGAQVWPTMQDALGLDGLNGLLTYPVRANRASANGAPYTGVVVQFEGDGIEDPHAIYRQLDAVKHQYRCFAASFLSTGTAAVVAPAATEDPCQ
jgi:hypothetical protein